MPEFILSHGSTDAARIFKALDAFTQGYVEAMFFTETGSGDDGDLQDATFADLAPEAFAKIVADCAKFQAQHQADIDEATDTGRDYDDASAGRDFWFTRCGHGVGFWDRGLGAIGDTLSNHAKAFGGVDLYVGDDDRIYYHVG